MPDLPSGTVTFLFTDIEGSTALWERDRAAMEAAVERHLDLLRLLIEAQGGVLFKTVGDAVQAAFPTASDTVAAALSAQLALVMEPWAEIEHPLAVRMAMHTIAAEPRDDDYLAPGLNRLSRLLTAAHGGQILVSLATQELARDALPPGATLRDLGEHPLRDLYRPERVYQLSHPDLPADFPPIRTLAMRPNNLPLQPTPFLGREEQVARVVDLLQRNDIRLLTITGAGGVGKTRLALQAAADLLESFSDGAWFVDVSALDAPSLVASAIGDVLGIREEGSALVERLGEVIRGKRLLLILDNFERVVEAASLVSDLLGRASSLKVLVTSRTPLNAYGEQEYPLDPLPLPDPNHLPALEQLSQNEAIRLFVDRARAVRPDFAVTNANAPAVAEICHRLDGLPLAIELAAAHVKVVPPQAMLKRLEKRLTLLTGGARTRPARQQTVRDTIAWSHDLLTQEEQRLFRRLAVFPAGCTFDAAEAVVSLDEPLDIYFGIASLVDKSLMRQEEGVEGEARFRMLETIREFGLERLTESNEAANIARRHAAHYLAFAEQIALETSPGDWDTKIDRLAADQDNLRAAFDRLCVTATSEECLRLAAACAPYWYARGHIREGSERLHHALAITEAIPTPAKSRVLIWASQLAITTGDSQAASSLAREALTVSEAVDDPRGRATALHALAMTEEIQLHWEAAARLYDEVIAAWRELGEAYSLGHALALRSGVAYGQGALVQAIALQEEAGALFRQLGNRRWMGLSSWYLGMFAAAQGRFADAACCYHDSLQTLIDADDAVWLFKPLAGLAAVAAQCHRPDAAARLLGAVDALLERTGARLLPFDIPIYEQAMSDAQGTLGATGFAAAYGSGRILSMDALLTEAGAVVSTADEVVRGGTSGGPKD